MPEAHGMQEDTRKREVKEVKGINEEIIQCLEEACGGHLYVLEFKSPCIRYRGRAHPDDFTWYEHGSSTLIVVPEGEDPEEVAKEFNEKFPLEWAGKKKYSFIEALHPVSAKIEYSIERGNVPISSLD
ncbi:MAG: hypothetical protein PHW75_02345 [Patescibacteria group bacterium]|nr:hypothetical protein [Patescibacteria group bacterium]